MSAERWLPVVGWEGVYEVSDNGRVRSLTRHEGQQIVHGRIKRPRLCEGYPRVSLCKGGKQRSAFVHRLVLAAFVGPCPEGQQCRHLDGNPRNNCLPNLAWGTPYENAQDRVRHGTATALKGEATPAAKLTEADVVVIRASTDTNRALATRYGVDPSTISLARSGRRWRHL